MHQTVPTPKKHIDSLKWLVSEGEYDDELHRRFHQSNWYSWTCESVENHIKYFQRTEPKQLHGCNASYAVFIQALVDHIKRARIKASEKKYNKQKTIKSENDEQDCGKNELEAIELLTKIGNKTINVNSITIHDCIPHIPKELMSQSGSVFYSGSDAFSGQKPLYVLGINPGGSVENQVTETVKWHTNRVLSEFPADWSAYRDESWAGAEPGTFKMQPRMLHLLDQLGFAPGEVPASNLIFKRSSREQTLTGDIDQLADLCWPFHQFVINSLTPRVILCLGKTPGAYVRKKMGAGKLIDEFIERNDRRWTSQTYEVAPGMPKIVVATHPSIVDWRNPDTDPTGLIQRALAA